jgi:hypothetical protein
MLRWCRLRRDGLRRAYVEVVQVEEGRVEVGVW